MFQTLAVNPLTLLARRAGYGAERAGYDSATVCWKHDARRTLTCGAHVRTVCLVLWVLAWLPIFCPRAMAGEGDSSAAEQALIELDWRKQDGIDTQRNPSTYRAASEQMLRRGDALLHDLVLQHQLFGESFVVL